MNVSALQTRVTPQTWSSSEQAAALRRSTGEFVGDIFYGTLLREMHKSKFKTKYLNGGRGEEAFQGQLVQELAQKMGRSGNDPVAQRLFDTIGQRLGVTDRRQPLVNVGGDA